MNRNKKEKSPKERALAKNKKQEQLEMAEALNNAMKKATDNAKMLSKNACIRVLYSLVLIASMWISLYSITEYDKFKEFLMFGVVVVFINSILSALFTKDRNLLSINTNWLLVASAILLMVQLEHSNFAVVFSLIVFALGLCRKSFSDLVVSISLLIYIFIS